MRTVFTVDPEPSRDGGHRDALTVKIQDHDKFAEFDDRASPSRHWELWRLHLGFSEKHIPDVIVGDIVIIQGNEEVVRDDAGK